jgi:hypothetical protein
MIDRPVTDDAADSPAAIGKIVEEARERLLELQPFLEEAERLAAVLAALDPEVPPPARGANGASPVDGSSVPRETTHVPARKARILAIIADHPGITAAEIADRHGMKRTVVASSISRLKRSGEIVALGGGVRLPRDEPE